MELPYELEELVLGCLVGDVSALRNCSLTCRRFTPIAQRFLFDEVEFVFTEYEDNARHERFRSFILSSSHIGKLVKSVLVVDIHDNLKIGRPQGFVGDTTLPDCLTVLTSLHNFRLANQGFLPLLWTSASPRVQNTLKTIFQSVTNISLYRIRDIPFSVFAGCVTLESLSLVLVSFIKDDALENSTHTVPDEDRPRLKSLRSLQLKLPELVFQDVANWFVDVACPLDISGLLKLSVTMTMEYYDDPRAKSLEHRDHESVARLLNACAKSLVIFCFSPTFRGEP